MAKQFTASQQAMIQAHEKEISTPLLYLSSADAGWEGLIAQAFHEPRELEGWMAPAISDISLVLFSGGAMRIEQRPINGSWRATHLGQGDMLLGSGSEPSYEVRWKSLSVAPTQTLHLHLSQKLLSQTAGEVLGCNSTHPLLIASAGFQDPLLTQIGFALWRELEQNSPAGKLYAQTASHMLAVHLLCHYTSATVVIKDPAHGLTHNQMTRVKDFILAHLRQDLSLEALAQQAGFSPYHFARLFRQTTGESPHQFVLRQRIEQAQHLLKETKLPLVYVALESGFANQSHLTQAFKRHLGLTPRTYRQDHSI